ncbi:uncharacterized protein AMSG_06012 [Thecamonas trahens ATCC 50062]|uniref:Peripheral subunit-binding (PSBD) domain-containing protein n=1 Tax=Thecamonas trahens ATCC 50062 TaxID=461836 RepID=A0A0L0DBX5_THETB|nr:hypothetical protein AMSG_06012 [Thecamonas trahens ATCC 50062]KNC49740.1 hypothetical protein AMSG_06012 [Thecamonas trahens ATCC 50062]|eukprot:XP_013757527.1 hypothetical protein AMSG_06012 [Thecamonas trahens ATCC 50062]
MFRNALATRTFSTAAAASRRLQLPSVAALAARNGWDLAAVLDNVEGTGHHGTVTKGDVLAYTAAGGAFPAASVSASPSEAAGASSGAAAAGSSLELFFASRDVGLATGFRVVDTPAKALPEADRHADVAVSGAQAAHAAAAVAAKAAAPTVYATAAPDVQPVADLLGLDLPTLLAGAETGAPLPPRLARLLVVAAAQALRSHPALNAHWDDAAGAPVTCRDVNVLFHHVADPHGPVRVSSALIPKAQAAPLATVDRIVDDAAPSAEMPTFAIASLTPLPVTSALLSVPPPAVAVLSLGTLTASVEPAKDPTSGALALRRRDSVQLAITADARAVDAAELNAFLDTLTRALANPIQLLM